MEKEWELKDFTVTAVQLAAIHGLTEGGLNLYARKGGFPFASREGTSKGQRFFHASTTKMMMGEIKQNMKTCKYAEPVMRFPYKNGTIKKNASYNKEVMEALADINVKLDYICEKLGIDFETVH